MNISLYILYITLRTFFPWTAKTYIMYKGENNSAMIILQDTPLLILNDKYAAIIDVIK